MNEVKATTLATEIAAQHNTSRSAAFDMILATAADLGMTGTRYTAKQAAELEAAIAATLKAGHTITLTRATI